MVQSIVKLMSMSRNEFLHSFKKFAPDYKESLAASQFEIKYGKGCVLIGIEILPDRKITSLLSLPQAKVSLHMHDLEPDEQQRFLERFDISFQRGGG